MEAQVWKPELGTVLLEKGGIIPTNDEAALATGGCGVGEKVPPPGRRVIPGKHFRDELENEGLTLSDALHVLRTGRIYGEPEQDIKTGDWKYRIEGKEVDGRTLKIVFVSRILAGLMRRI